MISFPRFALTASFFLAIMICLVACNDNNNGQDRKNGYSPANKDDSLFHEVMEGHDAAMAKMGKLTGSIKMTQQKLDSLDKSPSPDKDRINTFKTLSEELKKAENDMNDWMEKFSIDSARDNESVRLDYLESERRKVDNIKEAMLQSLGKADSLFQSK